MAQHLPGRQAPAVRAVLELAGEDVRAQCLALDAVGCRGTNVLARREG